MNTVTLERPKSPYAQCIAASKRVRWDTERDVIRGRVFDLSHKFLPEGLSQVEQLAFLGADQRRLLSQVQGRTYANMFGMIERYIGVKMMDVGVRHGFGDQVAFEALVRMTDEELKHQALFRRIEALAAEGMPAGYTFVPEANAVAAFVLGKSTWAVLALTCHIELFTQSHYRQSIAADDDISPLFKDVFLFHWKEESQHAILDELEWLAEDARLSPEQRDAAVDDLIALVAGVDGLLQQQAAADARYFASMSKLDAAKQVAVEAGVLRAYRHQYILSGAAHPHFQQLLGGLVTPAQLERIGAALATLG